MALKKTAQSNAVPSLPPSSPIFGVPLSSLPDSAFMPDIFVPKIVYDCVEFLRKNALRYKGLFRMTGYVQKRNAIREKVDRGIAVFFDEDVKDNMSDCHTVADLLKSYLRELPDSPVPDTVFAEYKEMVVAEGETGTPLSVSLMARLVDTTLPPLNYNLLKYICLFLNNVALFRDENEMDYYNLAVIFTPNFLRLHDAPCPSELVKTSSNWARAEVAFVKNLIENADYIFCHAYQLPSRAHVKVPKSPPKPPINMSTPISSYWMDVFTPLEKMRHLHDKPSNVIRPVKSLHALNQGGRISSNSESSATWLNDKTASARATFHPSALATAESTASMKKDYNDDGKASGPRLLRENAMAEVYERKKSQSLDIISYNTPGALDAVSDSHVPSTSSSVHTGSSGDLLATEEGAADARHRNNITTLSDIKTVNRSFTILTTRIGHV